MEDNLKVTLLTVCKLLKKYNVLYMFVGGTAVALNGYYRHSTNTSGELTDKPDIDIWYNPTYENYFKILKVIEELGQDVLSSKINKAQIQINHFLNWILTASLLMFYPQSKLISNSSMQIEEKKQSR